MLPDCYRWTDNPDICYLGLNYWQVAVLRLVDGKVHGSVTWQGRVHTFRAGSFEQAKRWTERWVAGRGSESPKVYKPRAKSKDKLALASLIKGCPGKGTVTHRRSASSSGSAL